MDRKTQGVPAGKEPWRDRRTDRERLVAELTRLAAEVDAVRRSQAFTEFMETMARFWHYSAFNSWLVRRQLPLATHVAGERN